MRAVVRMWNQPGPLVMMHSGIPGSPCLCPRIRLRSLVEDIDYDIGKRYDPDYAGPVGPRREDVRRPRATRLDAAHPARR
jgi:hypothetical protein